MFFFKIPKIIKKAVRVGVFIVCFIAIFPPASASYADVSEKDIEAIGKALNFVLGGPTGEVTVDIIYNENDKVSLEEANNIAAILSSQKSLGKVILNGIKTQYSTGSSVAFITSGNEGKSDELLKNGVITVSNGEDCVLKHQCILGVTTHPKVDFYLSSKAAKKAEVLFKTSFRMMVTEY